MLGREVEKGENRRNGFADKKKREGENGKEQSC